MIVESRYVEFSADCFKVLLQFAQPGHYGMVNVMGIRKVHNHITIAWQGTDLFLQHQPIRKRGTSLQTDTSCFVFLNDSDRHRDELHRRDTLDHLQDDLDSDPNADADEEIRKQHAGNCADEDDKLFFADMKDVQKFFVMRQSTACIDQHRGEGGQWDFVQQEW